MASTDTKRIWYPEVVTNHADRGIPGYEPICDTTKAVRIQFPRDTPGGTYWLLLVHPKTVEAWRAYVYLMDKYGLVVPVAGGTHHCRNIGTSDWPSLHAYCVALDLPPNDYKPAAFQAAVLKIKTKNGKTVFKNLASINDRMHDEIDCSPADLITGIDWSTVEGYEVPLTPAEQAALSTLVAMLDSRSDDEPPWGAGNWAIYNDEIWSGPSTSDPGPINPVTHIQLAKVAAFIRSEIQAGGLTRDQVIALINETTGDVTLTPPV